MVGVKNTESSHEVSGNVREKCAVATTGAPQSQRKETIFISSDEVSAEPLDGADFTMDTLAFSVAVNLKRIGAMSDEMDKMLAATSTMSEKFQYSKKDITTRNSGGLDRVSKGILDTSKQKNSEVIPHRVPFVYISYDRFISG